MPDMLAPLLVALAYAASPTPATREFRLDLHREGDGIAVALTNHSAREQVVPGFDPAAPRRSGYWLYLYDDSRHRLHAPRARVRFSDLGQRPLPFAVAPGQTAYWHLREDALVAPFDLPGGCYWLVGKFELQRGATAYASNVTAPLRVCFGVDAGRTPAASGKP
jgi:hypothetical protein